MALSKKKPAKAAAKKRNTLPLKRAKNEDGTFKGDDPSTPDVNEAFVVSDPVVVDVDAVREAQRTKPPGTRSAQRRLGGKLV